MRSTPPVVSPVPAAPGVATPALAARQAALLPILTMARPVVAFLPIDSGPDAFLQALQRQSRP